MARPYLFIAILLLAPVPGIAAEVIPGPVHAEVVSVYDGDTFTADAHPWPQITTRVSVRVNGVDTPEIRGKCPAEKEKAKAARDFVKTTLKGANITLRNVKLGKYAGRVIADVFVNGAPLAEVLIAAGLARPYEGGAREGWCPQ